MSLVKPIPSAEFTERLVLQKEVATQDPDTGSTKLAWVDVVEVWAKVEPMSVAAQYYSQALQAQIDTTVTIRYRKGVTAGMQAISEKHVYSIQKPPQNLQHANVYLVLQCLERFAIGE